MGTMGFYYDIQNDCFVLILNEGLCRFSPPMFEIFCDMSIKLLKVRELLRTSGDLDLLSKGLNTVADIEKYLQKTKG